MGWSLALMPAIRVLFYIIIHIFRCRVYKDYTGAQAPQHIQTKRNMDANYFMCFFVVAPDSTVCVCEMAMKRSKRSGNKSLSDHEYRIAHILKLG